MRNSAPCTAIAEFQDTVGSRSRDGINSLTSRPVAGADRAGANLRSECDASGPAGAKPGTGCRSVRPSDFDDGRRRPSPRERVPARYCNA
jgi:hypothetical protein